jgi:hypothetical protein
VAVHLAFDELQLAYLAFGLPIGPRQRDRRLDRCFVLGHAVCEGGDKAAARSADPSVQLRRAIFLKDAKSFNGNYLIDDTYLFENGVRDFDRYRVDPSVDLARGRFFVPDDSVPRTEPVAPPKDEAWDPPSSCLRGPPDPTRLSDGPSRAASGGPSRRSSPPSPGPCSLGPQPARSRRLWLTVFVRRANARSSAAEQSSRNLTAEAMARSSAPT